VDEVGEAVAADNLLAGVVLIIGKPFELQELRRMVSKPVTKD